MTVLGGHLVRPKRDFDLNISATALRRDPFRNKITPVNIFYFCHPERNGHRAKSDAHAVEEPAPSEVEGAPVQLEASQTMQGVLFVISTERDENASQQE